MVNYSLRESKMATKAYGCVASIVCRESTNLEGIIDYMVAEGSGLTKPQALAYFEKFEQSVEFYIRAGHSISLPFLQIRPSITGVFIDRNDNFDPSRHRIRIRTTSGARLRKLENELKVMKVEANYPSPTIVRFFDAESGQINDKLTPGGIGVINGKRMKFDSSNMQTGVFFSPVNDASTEIRVNGYAGIRPSEIHFRIPDSLVPGSYQLSVKNFANSSKILRKGDFIHPLTI